MDSLEFGFDPSTTSAPSGANTSSEGFSMGSVVNGLFGLAEKTVPALLQYRAAELNSQAKAARPTSLGSLALGGGSMLPIIALGVVAFLLLRD